MACLEPPPRPDEVRIDPLDVIGHRERGHLSHVGFSQVSAAVSRDNEVPVVDARPIRRGHEQLAVHAIGRLQLSKRERMLMSAWLHRQLRVRTLAGDFITRADAQRDPVSDRIIGRRYSSAQLVHECVRACTGVTLVDAEAVPTSTRERLVDIWGEHKIEVAARRGELDGEPPWTVLLPAHLFHALARDEPRASPLRPIPAQWDYPARSPLAPSPPPPTKDPQP